MKKIASIIAILLSILCMFPIGLSAAEMGEPIVWSDTDGDTYEDYTDSLGNMWMTLTIDEDGNRLIVSQEVLGLAQADVTPDNGGQGMYEGTMLEQEMETFCSGGDADTKINDTVYYLAPELAANVQPVVFPAETIAYVPGDLNTPPPAGTIESATKGLSYVDPAGEATCFALSATEVFEYLSPATGADSDVIRDAELAEGANTASDGLDAVPQPSGMQGYWLRSEGSNDFGAACVNSTGIMGNRAIQEAYGFRPAVWVSSPDTDMDGLTDDEETALGTNPAVADTDLDGLADGYEVNTLSTDPMSKDSDGDTITDADEDLDLDGLTNKQEFDLGTKPDNMDSDGDKVDDFEEVNLGQDGYVTNPLDKDSDDDGLDDRKEAANKTNPNNKDSDGDGVLDGEEVALGLDPNNEDSDNDGVTDGEELALGTDPLVPDNNDVENEETLEETGSKPFNAFLMLAAAAFSFALYTRFKVAK